MAILITGGTGYIGSHTAVELIQSGREVLLVDNLSNSRMDTVYKIREITGNMPEFFLMDVSDKDALRKVFDANSIEAIIHFAGYKAVGESVAEPLAYYRNNLDTTLTLLELMEEFGIKCIIFSSSATVYGAENRMPLLEDASAGRCTNPYGWTKFMSEQILKDAATSNAEFSAVLLRYFNPVGAHESGLIGEFPKGVPNNLMPYITQTAAGIQKKLSVFGNDYPTKDGTGVRDYIHVMDLGKGHVAALNYAEKHKGAEIFNLGTGKGYSVLEMIETFQRVNKVNVPFEIAPRRAGDIAECCADPTKAYEVLGWKAEKTLEDMCRDAWNWQLQLK